MSRSLACIALAVASLLAACGDDPSSDDNGVDAAGDTTAPDAGSDTSPADAAADAAPDSEADAEPADAVTGETDVAEPAPTFTQVRDQVIAPSCSFGVCHGSRSGAGGLALGRDPFAALVGVPSTAVPERTLVVPFDVDASYLWEKLTSETPADGELMPPGSPLDADRLELVRRWIEAGALNN